MGGTFRYSPKKDLKLDFRIPNSSLPRRPIDAFGVTTNMFPPEWASWRCQVCKQSLIMEEREIPRIAIADCIQKLFFWSLICHWVGVARVCAWWTKGRTNLAFIGEQNFWRSSPLHSLFACMTSSRILCTNTIQLFVDEWCKFWCRWYRFHILFIWFCHSFCPFFRQTTQTIHISLWNYNSECYIAVGRPFFVWG